MYDWKAEVDFAGDYQVPVLHTHREKGEKQ